MQRNIRKVAIFVGMPLAAVALAVFLLSWGNGTTPKAHAVVDTALNVNLNSAVGAGCNSDTGPAKCTVFGGSSFTTNFAISALPTAPGGYAGYDVQITYNTAQLSYVAGSFVCGVAPCAGAGVWPNCAIAATAIVPGTFKAACTIGVGTPNSTYLGTLSKQDFACRNETTGAPTTGVFTLTLVNGNGATDIINSSGAPVFEAANETITVTCAATPVPTPVPPTPTQPPVPRVLKSPVIQNVFLTRQGAKIPPATCEAGTNAATLNEGTNIPISSLDPKAVTGFQILSAFQFEVRFDPKLVCVSVAPGPTWGPPNAICTTLTAKGLVRFGCVSPGKCPPNTLGTPPPTPQARCLNRTAPSQLAVITVRPQPFLVNSIRPNQSNGIPVQLLNQGCQLSDEQGHSIPIFSCESASITFRFLEGDVNGPNCVVDGLDAQSIAMRWGAHIGSLLYSPFFDLSPSGQIKGDGVIDINDLQFVFGRLGSTCQNQWPPQPPVNPTA